MIGMKLKGKFLLLFIMQLLLSICAYGQSTNSKSDSTMVFGSLKPSSIEQNESREFINSMGVNLLVSTNGFGMGGFYRHEYTDDLAGFIDLSISEAKDDDEVTYFSYDYYTGQTYSYTPGKVNRFLMFPLMFGAQKRLFKDDILDNFRPYIEGAVGPTAILVFPYNMEYFTALGHGHFQYTGAAYVGVGAYFGGEKSNIMGLSMRYYYIPYPSGIQSFDAGSGVNEKTQFGGFYISLVFGSAW
jgi:hypothetical protein